MLLGLQLQRAGIPFMSAKAIHSHDGTSVVAIVCETQEDVDRANTWARENGHSVKARVASPEEVAEWRKWQEIAY